MACWSRLGSIPTLLRWTPSKIFSLESAARLSWCAKRMLTGRGASSKSIVRLPAVMKPQKLISVDFRRRKTRRNRLAVHKKRDRAFEIGGVGQHFPAGQE